MVQLVELVDLVVEVVKLIKLVVQQTNLHKTLAYQISHSMDSLVDKVVNIRTIPLVVVEEEVLAELVLNQIQPIMVTLLVVLLVLVEQIQSLEHLLYMVEVV